MKKKKNETIIETIHAKHSFSGEELVELSRQLGRTCSEITKLEGEKSSTAKDFSARIETKEIHRNSLTDKVTSGYEMRETDCIVIYDVPNRSKDYFRKDQYNLPGEFVERREMTHADFQIALPGVDPEPAPPIANPVLDPNTNSTPTETKPAA